MTPMPDARDLIDSGALAAARIELGDSFPRILGYFREDGEKSLLAIEAAMRGGNATALVLPAHTLKGEAHQFGCTALAAAAEAIEVIGRGCVESHDAPTEAIGHVAGLRALFRETMAALEPVRPAVARRPTGFGRRAV